jgi:hypothetical protein
MLRYPERMPADDAPQLTASQRLAAVLGKPAPAPLGENERREWEAVQDRADADAERIYGVRGQDAA